MIDSREPVEGSKRIVEQRIQQVLGIWHFSARDSLRLIWQASDVRRSPSLWLQPVSAHERTETVSLVYGHRRGLGATFYLGANFARTRDADAGVRKDQSEVFAKASWTFDML